MQQGNGSSSSRRLIRLVLMLLVFALWAPSAQATGPGDNGKLAVERLGSGIATVNSDGTGLAFVTFNFQDHAPVWNYDGTKLAIQRDVWDFDNDERIASDIVVMNADGTAQTNITNNPTGEFATTPAWATDSNWLAYANSTGSTSEIRRIHVSGAPDTVLHTGGTSPEWSSDNRIAFAFNGAIWIMKADGAEPKQISVGTTDAEPEWSPDSTKITFERHYCDSQQVCRPDIHVVDSSGANDTRLTNDFDTSDESPVFAPNGTKIVWSRWTTSTGNTTLVSMNPDGTVRRA